MSPCKVLKRSFNKVSAPVHADVRPQGPEDGGGARSSEARRRFILRLSENISRVVASAASKNMVLGPAQT